MQLSFFGHNFYPLLIIAAGSVFLTIGDLVAKLWIQHNRPLHFALTLALYLAGLVFLTFSFRYKNIALASMLLIGLNILTLTIWSWVVYGETLNKIEIAGLVLSFISLCLLEFGSKDLT